MGRQDSKITAQIEKEHAKLRKVMKSIGEELERTIAPEDFNDWKLTFMWMVRDFQNELLKHFDLEEDGGFMEDVVRKAPQEKARLDRLENEHREFSDELTGVTDVLKQINHQTMSKMEVVRERLIALFDKLYEHEASERDLIYKVYFEDIGVGD